MPLKPDLTEWKEAVHEFGEVRCDGCNERVDLSAAESVNEGIAIFNDHVASEHDVELPDDHTVPTTGDTL